MKPFLIAAITFYILSVITVIVHHASGSKKLGSASKWLLVLGLLVHSGGLIERIVTTGHAPMASMYETLVFFSWTTVLVSAIVIFRYDERETEVITLPVAVLALFFALMNEKPGGPLTLVLRTIWFETHVISSFAAYALFTLAFSGAVIYLWKKWKGVQAEDIKKFQEIAAKSILWGFFFFSASMFAGAVWAYLAWGTYWLWEPKVIWSFIVWFYYAGAMHAWYVREWRGVGLSIATVLGFFVVLFTYLGVSLLMKSSHSF
ncbi:MAG: cytochrome c biogenesis protein CcsA [Thermodesulfobacteriota bacterium]|nr:MAG: cytochrome c biogenesis protein CcsA [Thermodesulfobacteriota bacterium]